MERFDARISFDDPDALAWLEAASDEALDEAPFGIVAMDGSGVVISYNSCESRMSGLSPKRVLGRNFFSDVAPCSNNFMVAQKYEDETRLDEIVPYVFTLRMEPRRVRLRLLKGPAARRRYLLVEIVS